MIMRRRFALRVAAQQEPFILIAGYGQSGIMLARMLDRMGWRLVIVEMRKDRASIEITEFERTPDFPRPMGVCQMFWLMPELRTESVWRWWCWWATMKTTSRWRFAGPSLILLYGSSRGGIRLSPR